MAGKLAELAAEVESLRAEVAQLREQQAAHVCPTPMQVTYYPTQGAAPQPWQTIYYPGTYIGDVPNLIPGGWYYPTSVCQDAVGATTTTYTLNTAGAQ
jgi:hypothetical protein